MTPEERKQRITRLLKTFFMLTYSYAWLLFFYTAKIKQTESTGIFFIWMACLYFLIFSWIGLFFWTFRALVGDRLGEVGLGILLLFLLPLAMLALGPALGSYAFPWSYFY